MNVDEAMEAARQWLQFRPSDRQFKENIAIVLFDEVERMRAEVEILAVEVTRLQAIEHEQIETQAELAAAKAASVVLHKLEKENQDCLTAIAAICQTHGGQIYFTDKAIHEIGRDYRIETWRDLASSSTMIRVKKEQDKTPPEA